MKGKISYLIIFFCGLLVGIICMFAVNLFSSNSIRVGNCEIGLKDSKINLPINTERQAIKLANSNPYLKQKMNQSTYIEKVEFWLVKASFDKNKDKWEVRHQSNTSIPQVMCISEVDPKGVIHKVECLSNANK